MPAARDGRPAPAIRSPAPSGELAFVAAATKTTHPETQQVKTSAVHRGLESLAGREPRTPRRLDLHRLAGARVAALAGGALDDAEMSEAHDLHFAALLERRRDGVEG